MTTEPPPPPFLDASLSREKQEESTLQCFDSLKTSEHRDSSIAEDKVDPDVIEIPEEVSSVDDWENDVMNPRIWPFRKKWTAVAIVSLYTLTAPLASSMIAPGLPEVAEKYHITSSTTLAMTLSIFLLSFAIGPLLVAPLSEMYGRTWVLHIGNLLSMAFNLGCAYAPTTNTLIGLRFLTGLSSSAPMACGGGSISDLFSENDRASAMAVYSIGPLLGPVIGPIAGGFIAQTIGVRYVFIVIAGICGFSSLIGIPLLRETYAPIIRLRRARQAGDLENAAGIDPVLAHAHDRKLHFLWVNLSRPVILLTRSFICFILSLYMAFIFGILYLLFATFASFFAETYKFRPGVGGLAYLGLGIGFFVASIFGAKFSDRIYKYLSEKNGGQGKPEMRMPALFFGSLFVPVGLFWYGWSAQAKMHWIMPIIGSAIFSFGMMTCFLPIQLYLVDAFTYAASATSAAATFRSLFGFLFPLFGKQMFDALGLGGGNSLLAGLAIVLGIPFPVWIYYRGEAIRAKSNLTRR